MCIRDRNKCYYSVTISLVGVSINTNSCVIGRCHKYKQHNHIKFKRTVSYFTVGQQSSWQLICRKRTIKLCTKITRFTKSMSYYEVPKPSNDSSHPWCHAVMLKTANQICNKTCISVPQCKWCWKYKQYKVLYTYWKAEQLFRLNNNIMQSWLNKFEVEAVMQLMLYLQLHTHGSLCFSFN